MNKRLTGIFLSSILLHTHSVFAYPIVSTNPTNETLIKNKAITIPKTPLPFQLGGTKADSLKLLDKVSYSKSGSKILCEDSFTNLPDWSMYDGTASNVTDTHFSNPRLFFDGDNILQRVIFVNEAENQADQIRIYNKLKDYLDRNYTRIETPSSHAMYIDINEVVKEYDEDSHYGWVNKDGISYLSKEGYVNIRKESVGIVIPPRFMKPSKSGLYEEYSNLKDDIPEWKNGNSEFETVIVQHFSSNFSKMITKQCDSL